MSRPARGFSLVEQLTVIALVGAVAATALPALVDFKHEAETTALHSLAATAGSAMVLNQAGCLVTGGQAVPGKCQPLHDCAQVASLLMLDLPEGYRVPAQPLPAESRCLVVREQDGASAAFPGLPVGG